MWPKWLRTFSTLWVAWDSKNRKGLDLFWVIVIFILGPLLLPVYMAYRPTLKNERRSGSILWNILWNFEKLGTALATLAATAVCLDNLTASPGKDISEMKHAEIKAGSILGYLVVLAGIFLERIFADSIRRSLEK